ncbi:TOMM precursor leader peptide-binding protein, partial [Streptomyces laculatispora]|uniref:TOMM precursor leader peptide-binding protein n=1 Tax=Streptomyces laculatispora TaxID=887464 RepID=UPI001A94A8F6
MPTDTIAPAAVAAGPSLAPAAHGDWLPALGRLAAATGATVSANTGWDLDWERDRVVRAGADPHRTPHLSVRIHEDEVMIGPLWAPGTDAGCAACAEVRERTVLDHPLVGDLTRPAATPAAPAAVLPGLLGIAVDHLAARPLAPGDAVAAGAVDGHRVRLARGERPGRQVVDGDAEEAGKDGGGRGRGGGGPGEGADEGVVLD